MIFCGQDTSVSCEVKERRDDDPFLPCMKLPSDHRWTNAETFSQEEEGTTRINRLKEFYTSKLGKIESIILPTIQHVRFCGWILMFDLNDLDRLYLTGTRKRRKKKKKRLSVRTIKCLPKFLNVMKRLSLNTYASPFLPVCDISNTHDFISPFIHDRMRTIQHESHNDSQH